MNTAWLKKVAVMERAELIEAFDQEAQIRHDLAQKLPKLEQQITLLKSEVSRLKAEQDGYKTIVACTMSEAQFAAKRMGLNPNRTRLVATDSHMGYFLRGLRLDPIDVYFVRGWKRGRYWSEITSSLEPTLVRTDGTPAGLGTIAYAPDPHFDMHEDDEWKSATEGLRQKAWVTL